MSLGLFAVLVLSVLMTVMKGIVHRRQTFNGYLALQALRDQIAAVQETANAPEDLVNGLGIGALFGNCNGQTVYFPQLPGGQIAISVFANEATVPAVLGGPQDLNFDGDAGDDLTGLGSSVDLKLVPMTFVATYTDEGVPYTLVEHRLITRTSD